MKLPLRQPALLLLAFTGVTLADLPRKAPLTRYSGLWMNSPFTSKPPPPDSPEAPNPLDDYALIGVSPIGGSGYRVTLINKKKPEERITVDSDKPQKGSFKVLEVIRKPGDPLGTTVRMNSGSMTGSVAFDSKLLTLAAAPQVAPPQPGQPPIPGQVPQVDASGAPIRQPRPRVVPPPAPQAAGQATPPPQQAVPPPQPQRPPRRGN